ncbi:MAG: hypothetical protein WBH86_06255 [Thermogutta sp.]|nr:hypothetical protein [Thermogutta sp.]HOP76450.1 hypothetical protein [Thermogutta sp.]HPU05999.1 hypothetical protein [Thermogutta sp.]HQF14153.1 hypothetical protein [Thermogutta sp.]
MDARFRPVAAGLIVLLLTSGASYPTPNFVIHCGDPQLAKELGDAAENYRKELARLWLGKTLPDWSRPCPVTVHVGPNLGAGGATTFVFDRGEVYGWQMTIQGSRERLLDSVLPHEITHMILASHFRQPLPRWADEGAATTVEHISEREKHRRMLLEFLQTRRGISFRRMFAMEEYPRDIMPLYAQGYTLAEFLIQQGGHRRFIQFLETGLKDNQWEAALSQWYPYKDLSDLQTSWVTWVAQGYPQLRPLPNPMDSSPQQPVLASLENQWRPPQSSSTSAESVYQRSATQAAWNASASERTGVIAASYDGGARASQGRSDATQAIYSGGVELDVNGWRPAPLPEAMEGTLGPMAMASSPQTSAVPSSPGVTAPCSCGQTVPTVDTPANAVQFNQVAHPRTAEPSSRILLDWNRDTPWR